MFLQSREFVSALLADAAYAPGLFTRMSDVQIEAALRPSMTPTLAQLVATNFEVAAHSASIEWPVLGSGFDATVWRGRAGSEFAGKIFLSIRGTSGFSDALADVQLTITGNAGQQVIDMVNWWLRISTPRGVAAPQGNYEYNQDGTARVWNESFAPGEGLISDADLRSGVEVVGHSLGGYLATAFTRLLGVRAHVSHTSTFNSAGFAAGSELAFLDLQTKFGASLGIGRFPTLSEQSNYFASNGLNVTAANGFWFEQIGRRLQVYNEEGIGIANHSMYKLTDSLGLFAAMSKLDPGLPLARFNEIVALGSHLSEGSLEGVLDALRRLLIDRAATPLPVGDSDNTTTARSAYEVALVDLQDNANFTSLVGKAILQPIGANLSTQAKAHVDFQTVAALQALSPFVIDPGGAEGQAALQQIWQSLHARDYDGWLADNAALNAGKEAEHFTDEYLTDRSVLLQAILTRSRYDITPPFVSSPEVAPGREVTFVYQVPGIVPGTTAENSLRVTSAAEVSYDRSPQLVVFGGDGADSIAGTQEAKFGDHLYGGAGSDFIDGQDGDDYLEGGLGDDVLVGGKGVDTLRGGAGDDRLIGGDGHDVLIGGTGTDRYVIEEGASGLDVVRDADGLGSIVLRGQALAGGKKVSENTWRSDDGEILYVVAEGNLVIRPGASSGSRGVITVQGWKPGELGIVLSDDSVPSPQPSAVYAGDFAKKTNADGTRYLLDERGQYVANGRQPNAPDLITGTGDSDSIQGAGGDDALLGLAGDDRIEGGDGNDVIMGGLGADWLQGGAGRDLMFGSSTGALEYPTSTSYRLTETAYPVPLGEGFNWRLTSPGPDADGYQHGFLSNTVTRDTQAGDQGNVIDGGAGDDIIYAGTGNDVVHAGTDNDQVMGLSGDDVLFGDDGNDRIYGDGPSTPIESLMYTSAAQHGNDVLVGGLGNDLLLGQGGNDVLYGGAGRDVLYGDDREDTTLTGEDYLDGGADNDTLYGGKGDDILVGGTGDDVLRGGEGRDIYVINRGDGTDVIEDSGRDSVLRLGPGINRGDIALGLGSLLIGLGSGDSVHVAGFDPLDARGTALLAGIEFADGTSFSADELLDLGFDFDGTAAGDSLQGTSVNDRMRGLDGSDLLVGLGGDDLLDGGGGDDQLDGGAGNDTLMGAAGADLLRGGSGDDTYRFAPGSGHDMISDAEGTNRIAFEGGVAPDQISAAIVSGLLKLTTAAGDSITIDGAVAQYQFDDGTVLTRADVLALVPRAGDGPGRFDGGAGNDTLTGGPGDDVMLGGLGDDSLDGAGGADMLFGGAGNDLLRGGAGTDALSGGAGNDSLYGDDADDRLWGQDGNDTLDGGAGNDEIIGGAGDDLLIGGPGHDVLVAGGAGAKTYRFGAGDGEDIVTFSADARHIQFGPGILQSAIKLYGSPATAAGMYVRVQYGAADSVLIELGAGSGTLDYAFADGMVMSHRDLGTMATRPGGAGYMVIGTSGDDWLNAADSAALIDGAAGNDYVFGGAQDDVLRGGSGNDMLRGLDGNDVLEGGIGSDAMYGGPGSDVYLYARGGGSDVIGEEAGGFNVLRFTDLNAADLRYTRELTGSLTMHIGNSSDTIELVGWYGDSPARLQQIDFADGTVLDGSAFDDLVVAAITADGTGLLMGTAVDDVMIGGPQAEVFDGAAGNDTMTGGAGADVYTLRWGMGRDTIAETAGDTNVLALQPGLDKKQLQFRRSGADLVVDLEDKDSGVILKDYYSGMADGWLVRGADGTQLALAELMQAPATLRPVTIDEIRSRWLAEGASYYQNRFIDPLAGGNPADSVSVVMHTQVDDARDIDRGSSGTVTSSADQWVMLQVPESRYDVQYVGAGKLVITDLRSVSADGYPADFAYDPAQGFRLDWIGKFDVGPLLPSVRTVSVRAPAASTSYAIDVDGIAGGPSPNSIGTRGFGSVDGGDGDDVIWAFVSVGDDYEPGQFLSGGRGNDFVMGGYGKDMVVGGEGDDYLAGSYGPDTYYLFAEDNGTKIIDEAARYWSVPGLWHQYDPPGPASNMGYQDEYGFYRNDRPRADDVVEFGAGITLDQLQVRRGHYISPYAYDSQWPDPADQEFETLDFSWGAGKVARVLLRQPSGRAFEDDGTGIELFKFADGTTYTLAQALALAGASEPHTLSLWQGDGAQSLVLTAAIDSIRFGPAIAAADLDTAQDASDLVVTRRGTSDEWRLLGWFDDPARVASFAAVFADGTTWSGAQLLPQNHAPTAVPVAGQQALEDQPWSFQLPAGTFVDTDARDSITYRAESATGEALPAWLSFDAATRTFVGTPTNRDVGNLDIQLTGTDASGASASTIFELAVMNLNDAPAAAAAAQNQSAVETRPFSVALPEALFIDEDVGDALTWSVQMASGEPLPAWLSFDPELRLLHGRAALGDGGTWSLRVTARDGSGAAASQMFDVNVSHAPRAGEPIAPQAATEDSVWSFVLPDNVLTDADQGDVLSYEVALSDGRALPPWLSFQPAARTFTGTPANQDVGGLNVRVTATDSTGASASAAFRIDIANVNDAPELATPFAEQQLTEDVPWSYALPAGTFVDVDAGDQLTYSACLAGGGALPSWLRFDAATGTFSGTAENQDVGAWTLTVTATDAAGAAVDAVLPLSVANVNDAPMAGTPLPAWSVVAGDAVSYAINADAFTDVDAADQLAFSAALADGAPLPGWLTFAASSRLLAGVPAAGDAGDLTVKVVATDLAGASASQTFALQVKPGLTLQGSTGADTLTGRGGNDFLDGGNGADRMSGGKGNDTYVVSEAGDMVIELANEGIDTVHSAVSYTLPANVEQLFLDGSARGSLPPLPPLPGKAMVPGLTGTGNALDNLLVGNAENNVLTGGAGNDTLDGAGGSDRLVGGTGNDVYLIRSGSGRDTIEENDATPGNADSVLFGPGIAIDQLWFRKQGNDLQISITGTDDVLSIGSWYKGSQYHVEQFRTSDGRTLLDSQVQRLVDAMAAFNPPALGQTSLPAGYLQQLTPMLAASWQ